VLSVVAVVASSGGALLGLRAATIEVRDKLDAFRGDAHLTWAAWTATIGCIATALTLVQRLIELLPSATG
jgi:hypothetical protein